MIIIIDSNSDFMTFPGMHKYINPESIFFYIISSNYNYYNYYI